MVGTFAGNRHVIFGVGHEGARVGWIDPFGNIRSDEGVWLFRTEGQQVYSVADDSIVGTLTNDIAATIEGVFLFRLESRFVW